MLKIREKLWSAVYKLAKKKFKDAHLSRIDSDIKCPGCNEWFSVSGIEFKHRTESRPDRDFTTVICGQCGTKSNWSPHLAPCLVLVDDGGEHIIR